jgi:peptidoglycan/xylan/chitin deacetylase (PgdA/CDA1 family)
MATLYWRHPYAAFLEHTRYLDKKYGYLLKTPPELNIKITFELLTIPSIITQYLVDIAYCSLIIYLLTREPVKKLFNK